MHYPDSRWQPRCQGKSRDDVSGRILVLWIGTSSLALFQQIFIRRHSLTSLLKYVPLLHLCLKRTAKEFQVFIRSVKL